MAGGKHSYFGKYRGTVENNIDPQGLGRVQVSVPDVLGDVTLAWAMPCSPYAGDGVGFFAVPPTGASVWIEFERGDPDYPILAGCFWGMGEPPTPPGPLGITKTVLKTDKFTLEADSNPALPMLTIEIALGGAAGTASIKADATGLTLSCAGNTIAMTPTGVAINNTNLVVMK
ncbi:phage baseplate assembly protein V [Rhizobium terrae]|uniref:phage baseplate assembly protein V n=1 Tax=Rhizobium terrae TaxID=2171756 RepID=UPI000E3B8DC4|nr:phage baseplate assembly protein V [Rhizobium terrae]